MELSASLLCVLQLLPLLSAHQYTKPDSSPRQRDGKFFGIFNIVTFPNSACNTSNDQVGVCYSAKECGDNGGLDGGECAAGFGICCIFVANCNAGRAASTFDQKVSYVQNPSFPRHDTDPSICMVTIPPANEDICQVRLDFMEFELDGGSAVDRACDRDVMRITGSDGGNLGVGDLCGENGDQHLYLPLSQSSGGSVNIRIVTSSRGGSDLTAGYKWNIRITQVDCRAAEDASLLAPDGCAQYHVEQEGVIRSFNFNALTPRQYPRNLNYAICLRRPPTACEVRYVRDPAVPAYAMAVGKARAEYKKCGDNSDNGCDATECIVGGDDEEKVTGDYVLVTGGAYTKMEDEDDPLEFLRNDYYCGTGLGQDDGEDYDGTDGGRGVISQVSGPIVIRFVSDDRPGFAKGDGDKKEETDVKDELGFSYKYKFLTSCTPLQIGEEA